MSVDYYRQRTREIGFQELGDPELVGIFERLIEQESGFDPIAFNKRSGAAGIGQFMPPTATAYGIDPYKPEQALPAAARYLKSSIQEFGGDIRKAVGSYYAGTEGIKGLVAEFGEEEWENAEDKYPGYKDLRLYVNNIAGKRGETPYQSMMQPLGGEPETPPGFPPPPEVLPDMPTYYEGYQSDYLAEIDKANKAQEILTEYNKGSESIMENLADAVPFLGRTLDELKAIAGINTSKQAKLTELRTGQEQFAVEMQRTEARAKLIQGLPAAMAARRVTSKEDMLRFFNKDISGGAITDADEQWAGDLFDKLSYLIPRDIPMGVTDLHNALKKPFRPTPVGIHSLTDRELLSALTTMYNPGRPGNLTWAEQAQLYDEARSANDPSVQEFMEDMNPYLDQWLGSWSDYYNNYALYRSGLKQPVAPPLSAMQRLQMAVTSPVLAISELLAPWNKHIVQPLAAMAYIGAKLPLVERFPILGGAFLPAKLLAGTEPEKQQALAQEILRRSRLGPVGWEDYGEAWRSTDIGGVQRFMTEFIYDPLIIAPEVHGILAGSATIRSIPILGRFVGDSYRLGMFMTEAPIKAISFMTRPLTSRIPQTVHQKVSILRTRSMEDLYAANSQRFNKPRNIQPSAAELRTTINASFNEYWRMAPGEPQLTPSARLGGTLSQIRYIESDDMQRMARALGVEDFIPTRDNLLTMNQVMEIINPMSVTRKKSPSFLKAPQAAELLLTTIGAPKTPARIVEATKMIAGMLKQQVAVVRSIASGDDAAAIVRKLEQHVTQAYRNNIHSKINIDRMVQNSIKVAFLSKLDKATTIIWRNALDRQVVSPMAANSLYFPGVPIGNVVESYVRAALRGGLRWDRDPMGYIQRTMGHLSNVPYFLTVPSKAAEMRLPNVVGKATPKMVRGSVQFADDAAEEAWLMRIPGISAPFTPLKKLGMRLWNVDIPVTSLRDFYELSGQIGADVQRMWLAKHYENALWQMYPNELKAIVDAIPSLKEAGLKSLDNKTVDYLEKIMLGEAKVSPERVAGMKPTALTIDHLKATANVQTILDRDTVIPHFIKQDLMRQADSATIWKDIDAAVKNSASQLSDTWIARLEFSGRMYARMAKTFETLEVRDTDHMMSILQQMYKVASTPEDAVKAAWTATRDKTDEVTGLRYAETVSAEERDKINDVAREYIGDFLKVVDESTEKVFKRMAELVNTVGPANAPDLTTYLGRLRAKVKRVTDTRHEIETIWTTRRPSKPKGGTANELWWKETQLQWETAWNKSNSDVFAIENEITSMADSLTGTNLPDPFIVRGQATVADVAKLFMTTGDGVSKGLFLPELQAFMDKATFKRSVMARANSVGRKTGLDAESMGFNSEQLDGVWDSLLYSMNLEPSTVTMATPHKIALEGIRQELHTIFQGMKTPVDDVLKIQSWIDQTVANLKRLPMFQDEVSVPVNKVLPKEVGNFVSAMLKETKEGQRAVAGIDPRILGVLGGNLYSGDLGKIAVKEMVQNAVDSVKAVGRAGGKVDIEYIPRERIFRVRDNGIGMTPEVAAKELVDVGGSYKPGQEVSGGFGIAKVAIFANSDNISVVTVARTKAGKTVETVMNGSGKDWLDPDVGLSIVSREVSPDTPTGTVIEVKLSPNVKTNLYEVEQFLGTLDDYKQLPLDIDIRVSGKALEKWTTKPELSKVKTIDMPGGTLEFYTSDVVHETSFPKVVVLNNGLPQFSTSVATDRPMSLPSQIVVNVKSRYGPEHPNYPFRPDREGLRETAQSALDEFVKSELFTAAVSKQITLYRRVMDEGRILWGTGEDAVRIVDTQGDMDAAAVMSIGTSKYVAGLAEASDDIFNALVKSVLPFNSDYANVRIGGIGLGSSYLGVNVRGSVVWEKEGAKDFILINPFNIMEEVEQAIKSGIIRQSDRDLFFTSQLQSTMIHEITHTAAREHYESFAGELTRNIGRALPNMAESGSKLQKELTGGMYDGLAESFRIYKSAVKGGADILGPASTKFGREARPPRGGKGAPEAGKRQRGGLGEGVPVGVKPEEGVMGVGSQLEAGIPTVGVNNRQLWLYSQEKAMDVSRTEMKKVFTDYSGGNMLDAFMKSIHPFWSYEFQRLPWLWRTFARRPGMLTAGARYYDETDEGRVPIPGTSLEINPFAGTVFMGGFRGLYMRDYPEYLDAFPGLSNVMDRTERFGFYPNVIIQFMESAFMTADGSRPQFFSTLPNWMKTPLDAFVWQYPESGAAKWLRNQIMGDRFRDYMAADVLREQGINGTDIWYKLDNNIELLPEEQSEWDRAHGVAAGYQVLFNQTGMMNFKPEEKRKFYEALTQMYTDKTGVPREVQETVANHMGVTGHRVSDVFPLDPLNQMQLNEIEGMKLWAGGSAPLLPTGFQGLMANINEYWSEREKLREQTKNGFFKPDGSMEREGKLQLDARLKMWARGEPGGISPEQWKQERAELQKKHANMISQLDNSDRFVNVPRTLEQRRQFQEEKKGIQPVFHPGQELLWKYYEIEPEWKMDEETGTMEWDYNAYYAKVDAVIAALPEPYKTRIVKVIQKDMTDMELMYWKFNKEFNRPYKATAIVELASYTPEQRAAIRSFTRANALERAALREVPSGVGDEKLIATYQRNLSTVRKNMRLVNPELNAWLTFWDSGIKLLTPEARSGYVELMQKYLGGVPVVE